MPGVVHAEDFSWQFAELEDQVRRLSRGTAASQRLLWEYDTFTITGAGDTAHTLSWLPYGINVVMLNGLGLVEGIDYTCNYTTGVVTVTATLTAGDILHIRYVTTGELMAYSTAADTGGIIDTFNRADNTSTLGSTSDGKKTWTVQHGGPMGIQSNQAAAFTNATWSIATVDSSAGDGSVSVTIPSFTGNTVGAVFRATDGSNYWYIGTQNNGTTSAGLFNRVAGGDTLQLSFTFAAGDTIKATFAAGTITCYVNGVSKGSISHGFNQTATLVGVTILGTTQRIDNFTWTS